MCSLDNEKYLAIEGSKDILGYTIKYREDPILLDPRNKDLGARLNHQFRKALSIFKKIRSKRF